MIRAENLSISYVPGENPALRSVSLCVEKAERVALIGANGAGKSTLLLALVGILPPAAGSASVCGLGLAEKKNLRLLRQKAALVFQNPDDQLFMPTVYEDIAFGPRNYGTAESLIKERAGRILEELGIAHLADRLAGKLSGGEKRLAALAGVLVMEPEILLLDEPSSFLDPRARRRLIRILRGLGQTLIIATHDLDLAREVCERTILLKEGQIAADKGTPRILEDARLLEECGL